MDTKIKMRIRDKFKIWSTIILTEEDINNIIQDKNCTRVLIIFKRFYLAWFYNFNQQHENLQNTDKMYERINVIKWLIY